MIKKAAAATTAVMLAAGLSLVAVAGPASAHTPNHEVSCEALSVDLKSYQDIVPGTPAVEAVEGQAEILPTYETQPNPAYVPAFESYIEHDAVTHTEYKFVHKFLSFLVKWDANPNWNAEGNPNSSGFNATGETRLVEDEAAWTETVQNPAVGAETIEVMTDPGQPFIETVEFEAEIPAKVNTVVVTVDGAEVENTTFGKTFSSSYTFDKYTAHDWSISVTAHDDAKWNYEASGTTTPCERETIPGIVGASISDSCGVADLTLTNNSDDSNDTQQAAYSATIWVDGEFNEAVAVFEGDELTRHFEFAEDSGDHEIRVLDFDGNVIVEATVSSDCILPQPEETVVHGEWVAGEYECDATEVEQTRTVSTTPFVLVEGEWVAGETVESTETETRDLTDAEKAENVCPTPVVPEEPTVTVELAKAAAPSLAYTGSDLAPFGYAAAILLALGSALLVTRKVTATKK